jgi:hypothetical protein
MSKITKITDGRDKVIDQLIDDKNKLYTQLKRAEKKNDVHLSQIEHWKLRYNLMRKRLEERINEENNNKSEARRSASS